MINKEDLEYITLVSDSLNKINDVLAYGPDFTIKMLINSIEMKIKTFEDCSSNRYLEINDLINDNINKFTIEYISNKLIMNYESLDYIKTAIKNHNKILSALHSIELEKLDISRNTIFSYIDAKIKIEK
jgi:hypothetical protein